MKAVPFLFAAVLAATPVLPAQTADATAGSTTSQPAHTPPTPAQMAQRVVQRYTTLLSLSAAQEEQALTLFTAEETSLATLRTTERTSHQALETAIKAANTGTITELSATLGQLSGQGTLARSLAEAQFYALLTADQRTKLAEMHQHGPHGDFGPGPGGPR